eukprot:Unigene3164_Nuclearia_a/m.9705 Unigene3164_Nuclearia_a/g.9705  ORF Unigene3164_Nuclearia_a/g.9705 Unigene3164_Nuclearia_a/m.9705 type:complete len:199 (+) Unigene3164_Nuclearia_a:579-1175(+)
MSLMTRSDHASQLAAIAHSMLREHKYARFDQVKLAWALVGRLSVPVAVRALRQLAARGRFPLLRAGMRRLERLVLLRQIIKTIGELLVLLGEALALLGEALVDVRERTPILSLILLNSSVCDDTRVVSVQSMPRNAHARPSAAGWPPSRPGACRRARSPCRRRQTESGRARPASCWVDGREHDSSSMASVMFGHARCR